MILANIASTAFERRNDVDATEGGSRIRRGPPVGATGETTPERDTAKRVGEAAASIAGYIPSEIVTVYVAAIALVTDPARNVRPAERACISSRGYEGSRRWFR